MTPGTDAWDVPKFYQSQNGTNWFSRELKHDFWDVPPFFFEEQ